MANNRARLASSLSGWIAPADIEDLIQEAFLRALTRPLEYRGTRSTYAWLRRLLRNLAIDHIRHEDAEQRARIAMAEDRLATSPTAAGSRDEASASDLFVLLDEIGPTYAEVVRQVDVESRSIEEVAQALGLTRGNVRVRLHRARARLRAQWSKRRSS